MMATTYFIGKTKDLAGKFCNYSIGKITINLVIQPIKWLAIELTNLYCGL